MLPQIIRDLLSAFSCQMRRRAKPSHTDGVLLGQLLAEQTLDGLKESRLRPDIFALYAGAAIPNFLYQGTAD